VKKGIYLFLALLLPGLIFVFLKFAGKNEFNIPVFHEHGVAEPPLDCNRNYESPYRVPPATGAIPEVIVFPSDGLDIAKFQTLLREEFSVDAVEIVEANRRWPDQDSLVQMKKCIYLTNEPYNTVLVDKVGAIRGYYDSRLREEEDRLRVELKILLKRYE